MKKLEKYPSEPLKCWKWAKELRYKFYKSIADANEKGEIVSIGSAGAPRVVVAGLGANVKHLGMEPYGASVGFLADLSPQFQEACEKVGLARDLCSYAKAMWGSILLNKFVLPDGTVVNFPKPDVAVAEHICCTHLKATQLMAEYVGGLPVFGVDIGCRVGTGITAEAITYMAEQLEEIGEGLEKATGRKLDDELCVEAMYNESDSLCMWSEIATCQQAVPAPLTEKQLYSLYPFTIMCPDWEEVTRFYRELRDEVKDRVARGIGGVSIQQFRLSSDSQPPWGFLSLYRYVEKYGAMFVGSAYSLSLGSFWDTAPDGRLVPTKTLREQGIVLKNKKDAFHAWASHHMGSWQMMNTWSSCQFKTDYLLAFLKQWNIDAMIMHLNRGCEGAAIYQMENKLALMEAGIPVVTYEGNMADGRDFDHARTLAKIEAFLDSQGLKQLV